MRTLSFLFYLELGHLISSSLTLGVGLTLPTSLESRVFTFIMNYTTYFSGSLPCKMVVMSFLNLYNLMRHFPTINLCIYVYLSHWFCFSGDYFLPKAKYHSLLMLPF